MASQVCQSRTYGVPWLLATRPMRRRVSCSHDLARPSLLQMFRVRPTAAPKPIMQQHPTSPGAPEPPPRAGSPVRVLSWRGTDEELLQRLQRDRAAAGALLHDRFAPEVNGLVWRLLGADQEHDDLVHQIFCRLIVHAHRVREADKLAGWVRSVTVNTVYSELRKRGVRRLFVAAQSRKPEEFEDAAASLESRDLLARVYTVLDRLPAADRLAFSLRYIEGKRLSEVATLCDCSLATVKRRVARAEVELADLRRVFEQRSAAMEQGT
jgi:RNA polymerase sigma-70 factor, ECF subfamily